MRASRARDIRFGRFLVIGLISGALDARFWGHRDARSQGHRDARFRGPRGQGFGVDVASEERAFGAGQLDARAMSGQLDARALGASE